MGVAETFDRSARRYDASRRTLVPCFDGFYGSALAALPSDRMRALHVLDLGAGTGLLSMLVASEYPRARFTLMDVAPGMLEIARERFADQAGRFEFCVGNLACVELPSDADCAISALAIHHLSAHEKAALFRRIFEALRPGGVFVNAEQVQGETPEEDAENRRSWRAEARALGASEEELALADERMSEDQPSTVPEQLAWLSEAGFRDVACRFRHGMFAVLAARKPGS
jgi:tRNA (cmo5U34)-methyltransferase